MKIIARKILGQIEYLDALARMLECDSQAQAATLAAIDALQQLLQVIDDPPEAASDSIPMAA